MWKAGQLVTLWGKVYRIQKIDNNTLPKYRACHFCAGIGKSAPCLTANNYPTRKGFDMKMCMENMPGGCYPKLLNPKKNG